MILGYKLEAQELRTLDTLIHCWSEVTTGGIERLLILGDTLLKIC